MKNTFGLRLWCRVAASALIGLVAMSPVHFVHAQEPTAPSQTGSTVAVRPTACPLGVTGGLFGFFWGYMHAGYEWTDKWQRDRILEPLDFSVAEYVPLGGPFPFIESRDERARWYDPRVVARCTITETYTAGRLSSTLLRVTVVQNLGRVVEIDRQSCSTTGPDAEVHGAGYDPYAESGGEDETPCVTEGGSGTGGGTQYAPGDYTGGETVDWLTGQGTGRPSLCGEAARVEYDCIDIFDPISGTWEEWSCGYITTC